MQINTRHDFGEEVYIYEKDAVIKCKVISIEISIMRDDYSECIKFEDYKLQSLGDGEKFNRFYRCHNHVYKTHKEALDSNKAEF